MPDVTDEALSSWRPILERELHAGEKLKWFGRPDARLSARGSILISLFGIAFVSIPVMMLLAGLAGLWNSAKPGQQPMSLFLVLFLIPFLAIGGLMVLSPLIAYWRAGRTVHAVTSERVLTIRRPPFASTVSMWPKDLRGVVRRDHANELGTIKLDRGTGGSSFNFPSGSNEHWLGVGDARGAETAIRALMSPPGRAG